MVDKKFLVDFMLGRLAKWLRIWGYDAEYFTVPVIQEAAKINNRKEIILESLQQRRIILTRDHRLSRKRAYGLVLVKSNFFVKQLQQLTTELDLVLDRKKLFSRCAVCNVPIRKIEKKDVREKVPAYIYEIHNDFKYCPGCGRIYWPGTHLDLIEEKIKEFNT